MNIIVCIKQVPDTETKITIAQSGLDIDRSNISYIVNPYDENAVEEALRIKERLGKETVTVISMGPARVTEALRSCLAMGADKAIHLKDESFEESDSYGTALILYEAIKKIPYDIILCGRQAMDDDNGAVAIQLAELLNLPHVSLINKIEIDETNCKATVHRKTEDNIEIIECQLPAVFTCHYGLNQPRYASLPGIMKARQKPFQEIDSDSLGLNKKEIGKAGSKLQVIKMEIPSARRAGKILEGEPQDVVKELARLLREEAGVT